MQQLLCRDVRSELTHMGILHHRTGAIQGSAQKLLKKQRSPACRCRTLQGLYKVIYMVFSRLQRLSHIVCFARPTR